MLLLIFLIAFIELVIAFIFMSDMAGDSFETFVNELSFENDEEYAFFNFTMTFLMFMSFCITNAAVINTFFK